MAVSFEPGSVESTSLYIFSAWEGSDLASFCASAIRLLVSATAMFGGSSPWVCSAGLSRYRRASLDGVSAAGGGGVWRITGDAKATYVYKLTQRSGGGDRRWRIIRSDLGAWQPTFACLHGVERDTRKEYAISKRLLFDTGDPAAIDAQLVLIPPGASSRASAAQATAELAVAHRHWWPVPFPKQTLPCSYQHGAALHTSSLPTLYHHHDITIYYIPLRAGSLELFSF